jgi:hypothetical protein
MSHDKDRSAKQWELRKQRRNAIDAFIKTHSLYELRLKTTAQLRQLLAGSPDPRLKKVSIADIQRVIRHRSR